MTIKKTKLIHYSTLLQIRSMMESSNPASLMPIVLNSKVLGRIKLIQTVLACPKLL